MPDMTETREARVGFNVKWRREWPMLNAVVGIKRHGDKVAIFPKMQLPSDHPIVLLHPEYFR